MYGISSNHQHACILTIPEANERPREVHFHTHTHTHTGSIKPRISTDMTGHIYTEDPQIFKIWN